MKSSESVESDFQELHFSEEMKKLDGCRLFGTKSLDTKSLQAEPKYNVRKSLAWDSAFFTSPGVLEPEELFRTVNSRLTDNEVDIFGHEEEMLLHSGSLEPEVTRRVDKCDLRKSLAWDDAFFTNAGVLDPEELSIINEGFKNLETRLPGIEEDVLRSTESNFRLDSGCSSLTSLEIDLFEDIRASTNKSTNISVSSSSLKLQRGKALKKLDASSQTRKKDVSISRRQNINPQTAKRCTLLSGNRLAAGSGELTSSPSLKPQKSLVRVKNTSTISTKSASLGASFVKVETAKATSGQCLTISKKPFLGSSNSFSDCSTPSSKSSSSSAGALKSVSSRNSRFCNGATAKSPLNLSKERNNLTSINFVSSNSTLRTPLRYTRSNKTKLQSSHPSPSLLSTPKSSSCTSPDSSFDEWSSESSSSSVIEKSNSARAFLSSSCKQFSFEIIASQESSLPPSNISTSTKPSGLRMPSPKLGYFDSESSSVPRPVRSGISYLKRPANRPENGKLPSSRTMLGMPKQNELRSASQIIPKHPTKVEDVENASLNESATKATIKIRFPSSVEVERSLPRGISCKDCLGSEKMDSEEHGATLDDIRSSSKEEGKSNEGFMKNNHGTKHKESMANKKTFIEYDDSEKENICCFKQRVDGLCDHVGNIDLGGDVVIELTVKKASSVAPSAVLTLKI